MCHLLVCFCSLLVLFSCFLAFLVIFIWYQATSDGSLAFNFSVGVFSPKTILRLTSKVLLIYLETAWYFWDLFWSFIRQDQTSYLYRTSHAPGIVPSLFLWFFLQPQVIASRSCPNEGSTGGLRGKPLWRCLCAGLSSLVFCPWNSSWISLLRLPALSSSWGKPLASTRVLPLWFSRKSPSRQ